MLLFRIAAPRALINPLPKLHQCARPSLPHFRLIVRSLRPQLRCYAQSTKSTTTATSGAIEDHLKRQAKAASESGKGSAIAEKLLIYHAGTGRMTFLAMLKATSVFIGAFFCFMGVPGYIKAEKPVWETAGVALCGLAPILFIAYTTAPFVTHIHIHLPLAARASPASLARFVASLPPTTPLTLTTMSAIAKPRYSHLPAGELTPARRRFGIVNYARDTRGENEARRWFNFRAVGEFCVQQQGEVKAKSGSGRYVKEKKGKVEGWIWDVIKEKIEKKAAAAGQAA